MGNENNLYRLKLLIYCYVNLNGQSAQSKTFFIPLISPPLPRCQAPVYKPIDRKLLTKLYKPRAYPGFYTSLATSCYRKQN